MHPIKTYKFNKFEKLKKNRFTVDVFLSKKTDYNNSEVLLKLKK